MLVYSLGKARKEQVLEDFLVEPSDSGFSFDNYQLTPNLDGSLPGGGFSSIPNWMELTMPAVPGVRKFAVRTRDRADAGEYLFKYSSQCNDPQATFLSVDVRVIILDLRPPENTRNYIYTIGSKQRFEHLPAFQ